MNEAFLRSYRKILTAVLILLLIPLTVACFYDRPLGDELIQSLDAARAWRESGSLLQTFQKAFQMMARDYQTRSGIFFSMLLFAMPLSVFGGNWLVGVNALLTILLMLYGFWRVAGCLQSLCRGVSQEAVRCAGLLLGLMALLLLPDYHESIYWFGGAINYTVMSALAMLLFSAVFRAALDGKAPVWRLCLWCVGFFCLGGTNWMTPASSIVLYGAMAVWILITRRPKRLLLPYLFLLLGFATAALAPGNAARQETMNANVSFISAFLSSFQHSVLYFFSDARYWLFLLFLLPVFREIYTRTHFSFRAPLLVFAASVCIMAAAMFPVLYQCSYWAPRHTDLCFLLLCVLLPVNTFWLLGWFLRRAGYEPKAPQDSSPKSSRAAFGMGAALLFLIGALSLPNMTFSPLRFDCTLQPVKVAARLLDGSMSRYSQAYDALVAEIKAHPGEEIHSASQPQDDILNANWLYTGDPQDWRNQGLCLYYGDGCTLVYDP